MKTLIIGALLVSGCDIFDEHDRRGREEWVTHFDKRAGACRDLCATTQNSDRWIYKDEMAAGGGCQCSGPIVEVKP